MKYLITLLSIIAAFASYIIGSISGLVAFMVAGIVFEGIFGGAFFGENLKYALKLFRRRSILLPSQAVSFGIPGILFIANDALHAVHHPPPLE